MLVHLPSVLDKPNLMTLSVPVILCQQPMFQQSVVRIVGMEIAPSMLVLNSSLALLVACVVAAGAKMIESRLKNSCSETIFTWWVPAASDIDCMAVQR